MKKKCLFWIAVIGVLFSSICAEGAESVQTMSPPEIWAGYDPRSEPLDEEILRSWEEDGVSYKEVYFNGEQFDGKYVRIYDIYAAPTGGKNLPALLHIHGGGQTVNKNWLMELTGRGYAALTNVKRGYATISIAWAGRINAPDYKVDPKVVRLFFDNATDDPDYKLTTDWGALDAYHAPSRKGAGSMDVKPASYTLDAVESPRNCCYFLWSLAARRALTFLERQPEVDGDRLSIYGHSMGAKITVLTAGIDKRVKAAAPSCGGISNSTQNPLYQKTIADELYLDRLSCPIIFLSPSNDFHGHLIDVPKAVNLIEGKAWRAVSSPHSNHQDRGEFEVGGLLWFDQYLKGAFTYPKTPETLLELKTKSGTPSFTVKPDASKPIIAVDAYYTQQGEGNGREHRKNRFWHYAKTTQNGDSWKADLPLAATDKPLWVYANVQYALDKPVTGAGYYYNVYTTEVFNSSTLIQIATPEELAAAGVEATLKPSLVIESFEDDWEKKWFTY